MSDLSRSIDSLVARIDACRLCLDLPAGKGLPHEPRPIFVASRQARILVASQAPGLRAHRSGVPFMDPSGLRLREWLGVTPEEFYDPANFAIVPMGFCFPGNDASGGDLPPRRECAPAWRSAILAAMPQIDLVLTIGLYAQKWHLGARRGASLAATVANWRALTDGSGEPTVLPLPHPSWRNSAWLKRNPWFETDLLPFLRAEIRRRIVEQ